MNAPVTSNRSILLWRRETVQGHQGDIVLQSGIGWNPSSWHAR